MTPTIPSLTPLFEFQLPRNISGTDFGTGYGGTVCGFHTRPTWRSGVRSAMCAASQLPGRGPTVVDMAPVPAR